MSNEDETERQAALKVLLCGGLAGVVTWASIFPLDVIKTRVQSQLGPGRTLVEYRPILVPQARGSSEAINVRLSALEVAKLAYREEGAGVFFRGLGVCSIRAFIVNAAQVSEHRICGESRNLEALISVVDSVRVDDACFTARLTIPLSQST